LRGSHANAFFFRLAIGIVKRAQGQSAEGGMIIYFAGSRPNRVDIKGHLGLSFWYEPNLVAMLKKTACSTASRHMIEEYES